MVEIYVLRICKCMILIFNLIREYFLIEIQMNNFINIIIDVVIITTKNVNDLLG